MKRIEAGTGIFRFRQEWGAVLMAADRETAGELIRALWMYEVLGILPCLEERTELILRAMTGMIKAAPEKEKEKKNQKEKENEEYPEKIKNPPDGY